MNEIDKLKVLKEKTLTNEIIPIQTRVKTLKKLKSKITRHEKEIMTALKNDLDKPLFEAYTSDYLFTLKELNYTINNITEYLANKKVRTPLTLFRSRSIIKKEPYGLVLVLAPWNYPFQLTLTPLIAAYATGNRVAVKASNKSANTTRIITKIINETFREDEVIMLETRGDRIIPDVIDEIKFDKIFFTGSTKIGTLIAKAAAKTLTPTTLELGGKSPCIIAQDANLKIAARRIISSKYFNAGQTCIAPDYLLVDEIIEKKLIEELKKTIKEFHPKGEEDIAKIIDDPAYLRLKAYLDKDEIIVGGKAFDDELKIEPTLIKPKENAKIMQEEIFGPILPILTYKTINDAKNIIRKNPEPLALYLFTNNKKIKQEILNEKFGGGCINNTMMHIANPNLPFGGIGKSGMGRYHKDKSFDAFTYEKSILHTKIWPDIKLRYPPYNNNILKYIKRIL
ncbi:MAG: aldehyde dehydrogenase family protein [Candidatus Woesearchaeota archaeon]